jgi:deoxyribodipyrimidine photolyase-related protein
MYQSSMHVKYAVKYMRQETDYVDHHLQKVVAFFNAMRQFKISLESQGHMVRYLALDSPENKQNLLLNLNLLIKEYKVSQFQYLYPDEFRLDQQLKKHM